MNLTGVNVDNTYELVSCVYVYYLNGCFNKNFYAIHDNGDGAFKSFMVNLKSSLKSVN